MTNLIFQDFQFIDTLKSFNGLLTISDSGSIQIVSTLPLGTSGFIGSTTFNLSSQLGDFNSIQISGILYEDEFNSLLDNDGNLTGYNTTPTSCNIMVGNSSSIPSDLSNLVLMDDDITKLMINGHYNNPDYWSSANLPLDDFLPKTSAFVAISDASKETQINFGIYGTNAYNAPKIAYTNRWIITKNNDTESGSNTGSNFEIRNLDDSGSVLGSPLKINRATGQIEINSAYTLPTSAGTDGQVLSTNGSSEATWVTPNILQSFLSTSLPAGVAGQMITISDQGYKPAFFNGSNWLYVYNNTIV